MNSCIHDNANPLELLAQVPMSIARTNVASWSTSLLHFSYSCFLPLYMSHFLCNIHQKTKRKTTSSSWSTITAKTTRSYSSSHHNVYNDCFSSSIRWRPPGHHSLHHTYFIFFFLLLSGLQQTSVPLSASTLVLLYHHYLLYNKLCPFFFFSFARFFSTFRRHLVHLLVIHTPPSLWFLQPMGWCSRVHLDLLRRLLTRGLFHFLLPSVKVLYTTLYHLFFKNYDTYTMASMGFYYHH